MPLHLLLAYAAASNDFAVAHVCASVAFLLLDFGSYKQMGPSPAMEKEAGAGFVAGPGL